MRGKSSVPASDEGRESEEAIATHAELLSHLGRVECERTLAEIRARSLEAENRALRSRVDELSHVLQRAFLDPLTGLRNRRYFDARLREEVERSERSGALLALALIDIDRFKAINDRYGPARGDQVLAQIAAFLRDRSRPLDVCCRIGGDEFALILPDCGLRAAQNLVERFCGTLSPEQCGIPDGLRLSVGLATLHTGESALSLIERADRDMYCHRRSAPDTRRWRHVDSQ